MQNDGGEYLMNIKTIQAPIFKQVVDALKDILTDVNLEVDSTGIKIVAMDNTNIVLIHLKLEADKFEEYFFDESLPEKKLYIGICMLKLHMLIKTIGTNDLLVLYVKKDEPNSLGIKIVNNEKNVETNYKLSTLDIDVLNLDIPPVDFHTIITMPSVYLQKIIRDMHNLAEYIEIRNVANQLVLCCNGDFCTQETVLGTEKSNNITICKNCDDNTQEIIQGVFSLKYLAIFTKCTNLCSNVEIYLKNSYPIILKYTIASLGEIKLCLSQQEF